MLTSATIPRSLAVRLGLPPGDARRARRRQPVRLRRQRAPLLRRAPARPARTPAYEARDARRARGADHRRRRPHPRAVHVVAAMHRRSTRCGRGCRSPCSTRRRCRSRRSSRAFSDDEQACLFATMGFWQGVDVPGRRCRSSPSTGCRSPGPTSRCCRPAASGPGPAPSRSSTSPGPTTLLAQGAGRLIRSATDRGVVAVLDPRLGDGALPVGDRQRAAADAPHPRPRRGRSASSASIREFSSRGARAPSGGAASPCRPSRTARGRRPRAAARAPRCRPA